jgi:ATP-dependent DNA helicase RecG
MKEAFNDEKARSVVRTAAAGTKAFLLNRLLSHYPFFRATFQRSPEFAMKEGILGAEVSEKKPEGKTAQKTAQKIMSLIRHKPEITRQELAIELGITDSGIKYHLKKMQAKGLIRRVGPDKGGHWEVVQ